MSKTLDGWTAGLLGTHELTRRLLDGYTRKKLMETLEYAVDNSVFYGEKLGGILERDGILERGGALEKNGILERDGALEKNGILQESGMPRDAGCAEFFRWFAGLPFTTQEELRNRGQDFLCVSPAEISRIVTLNTGGTAGEPKRICFTEEDQQLTVDFFENGMQLIVDGSDQVLLLMPAKVPGSIGKLLSQGLRNFGAGVVAHGLPDISPGMDPISRKQEAKKLLRLIKENQITSVVALPTHMRLLAEAALEKEKGGSAWPLKTVLLSAEYVAEEDVQRIEEAFSCKVYEHYGMTEMGLGCAVSCGHGDGYHVREADLYLEIIDPETGRPAAEGAYGEIVFTTLTRKGMPFIRYRTGDYSRWITEPCPCGSLLKRLDKVGPRDLVKGYLR